MSFSFSIQPSEKVMAPVPVIFEPEANSEVGLTFTVSGFSSGCASVSIVIKNNAGAIIAGPTTVATTGGSFSQNFTLPAQQNISISVTCVATGTSTSVGGITVSATPMIGLVSPMMAAPMAAGQLDFTIKYNDPVSKNQSVVIAIRGRDGTGNDIIVTPHSFTMSPPQEQSFSIPGLPAGTYIILVALIDSDKMANGGKAVQVSRFVKTVK
jgi:hypothetical protein